MHFESKLYLGAQNPLHFGTNMVTVKVGALSLKHIPPEQVVEPAEMATLQGVLSFWVFVSRSAGALFRSSFLLFPTSALSVAATFDLLKPPEKKKEHIFQW